MAGMTKRATQRPGTFTKPAHWNNAPPPEPDDPPEPNDPPKPNDPKDQADPDGLSPTRYGDWVRKGVAVDF